MNATARSPLLRSRLPTVGTTIFTVMSALAQQHGAVNLGQGFPDFACDPKLLDADGRCVFGATVDLDDIGSGAKVTYQIVGDDEADLKAGKVSISSPIARALIGKYAGDVAEVRAPGGVREYEIIDVRYI